jgi:hypothetical protein
MDPLAPNFRQLDAQKIIETVRALHARIEDRFPVSGLGKVVTELVQVAEETIERTRWIQKPHLLLRAVAIGLSLSVVTLVVFILTRIKRFDFGNDFTNSMQSLDSSIGSVVFIGAAILFFVSWEKRIKRSRALRAIHELRALAHIIDMHQLTKDPEAALRGRPVAQNKPRVLTPAELIRYLDYCSDAMALISKIAALYVQGFQDEVLLDAVDDVEDLTAGFSRKIWQKITILESLDTSPLVPETRSAAPAPVAGLDRVD